MKFSKRLAMAWRILKNQGRQEFELNDLYRFLGIDPDSDERPLSEATYFACIKTLSEAIGKLPFKVLRYNEQQGVRAQRDHPLYRVIHDRPNPYMNASVFWSTVEFNRNHYGNAYVWIQGSGENTRLWILPSTQVEVWKDDRRCIFETDDIFYKYTANEKHYVFRTDEILHFKSSNTSDGIVGIPVREQLKATISGGIKSQKMLNNLYESGFTAKAVLQYTGSLSDENVETFVREISNYANGKLKEKGIENIIPLPIGSQLTPLNVKLADSQFIEIRQYSAIQISTAFGIRPYQIGDLTKSSYASAQAQQLSFYIETLLYIVKQYEEECSYKLLTDSELKNGYHMKFNIAAILRADLETQVKTIKEGINGFLYTPNEGRAMLDLEAKPGGDRLIGNGATIPVEMVGVQYNTDGKEN